MLQYLQRLMQKMQRLSEKELAILAYFYSEGKGHVRRIRKAVRLPEHTLLKYLKVLEQRKVLLSRRVGNLKMYHIDLQHPLVSIAFAYFAYERLEKLRYKRKKALTEFVKLLKGVKIPYFVLVFGSTAKGNYTKKSDVDLIIVHEGVGAKIDAIKKKIYAETGLQINHINMKMKEFIQEKGNKENFALQDALESGYPVFGNQLYYQLVFS